MKAYRITKTKFLETVWSGAGANQYGGRWNNPGKRMIYAASSISLAMLEILVHVESQMLLEAYTVLAIDIPDDLVAALEDEDLPRDWRQYPATHSTKSIGDEWLSEGSSVALAVPSVVVPYERNILLNPQHPAFESLLQSVQPAPLSFDPRLK